MTPTQKERTMTRTEARRIARQMVKSGRFPFVSLVEDLTNDEIYIEATNRCWSRRTVRSQADWADLTVEGAL